jgi:hypothetical protein
MGSVGRGSASILPDEGTFDSNGRPSNAAFVSAGVTGEVRVMRTDRSPSCFSYAQIGAILPDSVDHVSTDASFRGKKAFSFLV